MTGTTRSSEGLSSRRRKLLFRSWHRGMRETDLILGGFADALIDSLTDAELDEYERLLDVPDGDLLAWFTGEKQAPKTHDTDLLRRIMAGASSRKPSEKPA